MAAPRTKTKKAQEPALHQVTPREQVGAQTGSLYEYQYHQAAAGTLSLIDDSKVVCVYCEWHDDFVSEAAEDRGYAFHQVKTRTASSSAWNFSSFFGLRGRSKKTVQPSDPTSPFAHLWDHTQKFGRLCSRFVFVTNGAVSDDLRDLLTAISASTAADQLPEEQKGQFDRLLAGATQSLAGVNEVSLFTFLSKLTIEDGIGAANDLKSCRVLIAMKIYQASEVDLLISEAEKIGNDLVALVRERSHRTLPALPASREELQAAKGIVLGNLLSVLSLSEEGYRQLRAGGRESVVALSRLTRLCKRTKIPNAVVPTLCQLRAEYSAWWLEARDRVEGTEVVALKTACADLLHAHTADKLSWPDLLTQTKAVAAKYAPAINSPRPLTDELVLGLILDLAVESEA